MLLPCVSWLCASSDERGPFIQLTLTKLSPHQILFELNQNLFIQRLNRIKKCETWVHATHHKQITLSANNLAVDGLSLKEKVETISQFNLKGIPQGLNWVTHNPQRYDFNL